MAQPIRDLVQRQASKPPTTPGGATYMLREVFYNLGVTAPKAFMNDTEQRLRARRHRG